MTTRVKGVIIKIQKKEGIDTMTYPEPYAKDIFEAIAYTLTMASYMTTGNVPDTEDINVTTREIFNLFMERNKHVDKIERWG